MSEFIDENVEDLSGLSDLPDLEDADQNIITDTTETEEVYIDYHALSQGNLNAFERLSEDDQAHNNELAREKRVLARTLFNDSSKTRDRAILVITDAIELNPKSAIYLSTRGQFLMDIGNISAAVRDLAVAVERSPDHVTSHRLLGDCYVLLFDNEKALEHLKKAQQLDYSEEYAEKLRNVTKKIRNEQERQKLFEEKMRKEAEQTFKPKDKTPTYGNSKSAYGEKQVPKAFKVLEEQSNKLTPEMAQKLMSNETVAKAFADEEFAKKLDEVAKNPTAAYKYAGDKDFMTALSAVLGCCNSK